MREILFRGKSPVINEWVEGFLVLTRVGGKEIPTIITLDDLTKTLTEKRWFQVIPETVGQYTGLTDKNGKKIFEGDIVRHYNYNPYAIPSIIEKGVVYWDEEYCGWRRTSNGAFHHGKIDTYRMSHDCVYEIIGNIHDNPEIVEE